MTREISRWGVGPSIMVSAGAYAAVAGLATWLWPEFCIVRAVPTIVFLIGGSVLLIVGIPMLVVAARAATIAYNSDKLATTGIFGLTRNPIYSAWIVFIIPGLVLMSRSWPLFLTPFVAYMIFKVRIGRENDFLERHFGQAYREYKVRVNELVPLPRSDMNSSEIILVILMRLAGVLLLTALIPVVMPFGWMKDIHRALGMGELPEGPIMGYLTRSLSAIYAMHGALVFVVSLDVRRYLPVVKCLAVLGIVFGSGMFVLDIMVGMPPSWIIGEGPFIVVLGGVMLWLAGRVQQVE